jgi:murein DD-endopeptidase MepM/ murein hydrolase activator NlpD
MPWLFGERVRAASSPAPILLAREPTPIPVPDSSAPAQPKVKAKPKPKPKPRVAKPKAARRPATVRSRRRSGRPLASRGSYYRAAPVYVREAAEPPDWEGADGWEPSPSMPVWGVDAFSLNDSFDARRSGGRRHRAIDIMAPRGTPVVAADDGWIKRVASGGRAGLYVTQLDATGRFTYFYAHLDAFVDGLAEGLPVRRGEALGFVGTTGNAPENCPHLHFGITRIESPRRWWRGEAINPYPLLAY